MRERSCMGQFEHVIVGDAQEVLAEDLAGVDRVEARSG